MLKKNEILRLSVDGMNDMGNGVAHTDGLAVFVTGAVVGDTVDAKVIKVASGYAVARTERVVTPSPYRVENDCRAKGCGGCAYRCLSYEQELLLKENDVRFAFRKAGLPDVTVLPVLSAGRTGGYRNKAQYPVGTGKDGRLIAGFYAPKSHRVVEAVDCPLQSQAFRPMLAYLLEFFTEKRVSAYDENSGTGILRHFYFRANRDGSAVLLTVVIHAKSLPFGDELAREMPKKFDNLVGIVVNTNQQNTNVICGRSYKTLWGSASLTDELCGVKLSIAPQSFYQVNHDATELLYQKAASLAAPQKDDVLLDLYCGIGSIGLSMADRVHQLVGIEIVPEAIEAAKKNARESGIENAHFFCGDAVDTEKLLAEAERELGKITPDIVILDPPRKGATPTLLSFIHDTLAPKRIVYISCNPDTLARDVAYFMTLGGYTYGDVTPVDLFPRTGHVESVVCLKRNFDN